VAREAESLEALENAEVTTCCCTGGWESRLGLGEFRGWRPAESIEYVVSFSACDRKPRRRSASARRRHARKSCLAGFSRAEKKRHWTSRSSIQRVPDVRILKFREVDALASPVARDLARWQTTRHKANKPGCFPFSPSSGRTLASNVYRFGFPRAGGRSLSRTSRERIAILAGASTG